MKTTKPSHHATNATTHTGDDAMKTTKPSHHATNATTHTGDDAMKTTETSHATTNATTNEGETTMKTQANASHVTMSHATKIAPATKTATSPPSYLAACGALMREFDAAFPKTAPLTAVDKKRTGKARKGSERYASQLVALAQQFGVNLASVPLDEIQNASDEAQQLVPLEKQMERMMTRVRNRMFTVQATSWSGSTKLYAVLKRLSKDDGEIATGLSPVEQYFNHRHPLVAKEHPKTAKGKVKLAAAKAAAAMGQTTTATGGATAAETTPVPVASSAPPTATDASAGATPVAATTTTTTTNGAAHS